MNVLFVGTLPPAQGGGAQVHAQVLAGLAARGARVLALAPRSGIPEGGVDPLALAHPDLGIERYPLDEWAGERGMLLVAHRRERNGAWIRDRLPGLIDRMRPEVLLIGTEACAWHCADIARRRGLPTVLILHGGALLGKMLDDTLPADISAGLLRTYRSLDRLIAVAEHFAAGLARLGLEHVTVTRNPVDTARFLPSSRNHELLRQLGWQDSRTVVLFLGNLNQTKRPLDVVASAARCLRQEPGLGYLIVGDGPLRSVMEDACRRAGLMERFRFLGWIDHHRVPDHLAAADVVLLPSEVEIQSLACLESQACGRVVVASDIPANRELVVDGETGLLFPLGDVEALAEKTLMALRSPAMRAALGGRARRAAERHELSLVVDGYLDTLREVAGQARW